MSHRREVRVLVECHCGKDGDHMEWTSEGQWTLLRDATPEQRELLRHGGDSPPPGCGCGGCR